MKPLRAFPLPLNVGTDICQISRVYGILRTPRASRFVNRILAHEERPRFAALASALPLMPRPESLRTRDGDHHGHEAVAARDPEGWKAAAFMAGRCVDMQMSYSMEVADRRRATDSPPKKPPSRRTRTGSSPFTTW